MDCGVARQAVAIGADGAREDQRQPGRAVLQFVQRLGVGGGRIGMIDARLHRPGAAARRDRLGARPRGRTAARSGCRRRSWRQPLERPVLERRADKLQPVLAAGGRKLGGERQIVRHRPKCHGGGVSANAPSSWRQARTAPGQGTVILPSTTTCAGLVEMHHRHFAGIRAGRRYRLDVGHVRHQHGEPVRPGSSSSSSRPLVPASLIADGIGEEDLIEDGLLADRAELGELGGIDRAGNIGLK